MRSDSFSREFFDPSLDRLPIRSRARCYLTDTTRADLERFCSQIQAPLLLIQFVPQDLVLLLCCHSLTIPYFPVFWKLFADEPLAQVFHGLQVQLAAQEGVDPFEVSIDLLVEVVPRLLQRGIAPLPFLGRVGREVGLIRPSTRIKVQVPFVDATWITPAPPEALQPRDTVRYAQRKCAPGPRPKTKKAG